MPIDPLLAFALVAWRREPSMRIEDAYKWLYHATLGGEHVVSGMEEARGWMDREWSHLDRPRSGEPMTVSLRPDGKLLRVNLRPYKASGGEKMALLAVFVRSARRFHADKIRFRREWDGLGEVLKSDSRPGLTYQDWKRLDHETRPRFPAIEHSDVYLHASEPAYRVVLATEWRTLRRFPSARGPSKPKARPNAPPPPPAARQS